MSNLLFLAAPSFAEILIFYFFIKKSISKKETTHWYSITFFAITAFAIALCKIYIPFVIIVSVTSIILTYISVCISLKAKPLSVLLNFLMAFTFIVFAVEIPAQLIMQFVSSIPYHMILVSVIILVWGMLLVLIVPLDRIFILLRKQSTKLNIIIVDCAVIAVLFSWYFQLKQTSFYENILMLIFFTILIILVNYELITSYWLLESRTKQIETYDKYYPVLNEMILAVREKQHNYNDILHTIFNLPSTHKTYDDLVNALTGEDVLSLISSTPTYLLKTNLTVVAAYLYTKCQQAEASNKLLYVTIDDSDLPTVIPQYEIVEILGVLIVNAIEATPEGGSASISVMNSENGKIKIVSENQGPLVSSALLKDFFTPGFTTKSIGQKNTRGLGLPKLKKYVESKDGTIMVTNRTVKGVRNIVFTIEV